MRLDRVGGAKGTLNKVTNTTDDRATNTRIPETIIDGFRGDMHTLTNLLRMLLDRRGGGGN